MKLSMDMLKRRIFCILVCFLYICSGANSTRSNRSHSHRNSDTDSTDRRISHRLKQLENDILKKVNRKISEQSGSNKARELERRLGILMSELSLLQKHNSHKSKIIATLKGQLSDHESRITRLTEEVEALKRALKTVTSRVKHLEGGNAVPIQRPRSTLLPPTSQYPKDCETYYEQGGMKKPGLYQTLIQPVSADQPFMVSCKMINNTGWTVIQRRQDGSVDFFRTWHWYKKGFGSLGGELWLGLDNIYQLTNQDDYKLRIEMTDFKGNSYWAEYEHFKISNEADKYRLHVHDYHGNSGDSLTSPWEDHNNQPFSTKDRDNDDRFYDNCARHYKGAWWFKSCFESHLNGVYYQHGSHNNYFVRNGVQWNTIHVHSSLKYVTMMVTPNRDIQETISPNDVGLL